MRYRALDVKIGKGCKVKSEVRYKNAVDIHLDAKVKSVIKIRGGSFWRL
jgi:hypothetical protein